MFSLQLCLLFFLKTMESYKDICSTSISRTSAEFFFIDWRLKHLKNKKDLLLFYREHFYGFSEGDLFDGSSHAAISSLIYNTSARHERHECNTSDTSETRAMRVQHKCNTSATRATRVWHECYTNDTSATRVKNFDFDSDTSKNMFLHPYIYYMARERLRGEENFHSKNYLSEMSCFHAKMRLKRAPKKLDFLMTKVTSKSCTLDCSWKCPCTFPHSYNNNAVSFSIRTILCENTNILFSKNYWKLGSETTFKIKVRLRWRAFQISLTSAIICIQTWFLHGNVIVQYLQTTNVTNLAKVIQESPYRVLQVTSK